jgi:hypothetical protein
MGIPSSTAVTTTRVIAATGRDADLSGEKNSTSRHDPQMRSDGSIRAAFAEHTLDRTVRTWREVPPDPKPVIMSP